MRDLMHHPGSAGASVSSWLEPLCPLHKTSLRLLTFPHAGGSGQTYRSWQQQLGTEIGVCLAHLPGRGRRTGEPPVARLDHLVSALADAVSSQIQGPYAFFGHSMGAIVAFELARELRRRHQPLPKWLFVAGRRAPTVSTPEQLVQTLTKGDLIADLKRLKGTPAEVLERPDLLEVFLSVLKADIEVLDSYRYVPEAPLVCPIVVYGGREDHDVPIESLRPWAHQTSVGCSVKMLPGGHFFVSSEPLFLETLRRDLLDAVRFLGR